MSRMELIKRLVKTRKFAVVTSSALSIAAGAVGGYITAKKRLEKKYADLSEREIQEAKKYYNQKYKDEDFADPMTLAEKYTDDEPDVNPEVEMVRDSIDILQDQKYVSYDKVSPADKEVIEVKTSITTNVFDTQNSADEQDEFDLDDELDKKAAGKPYIIEEEQYFENEAEHTQNALTWFEIDEVLVDERDQPIRNIDGVIGGVENLRFGYGTKDKNMVYITNDRFNADYEISRAKGSYTEQVLGFKHSDRRQPRKFRVSD